MRGRIMTVWAGAALAIGFTGAAAQDETWKTQPSTEHEWLDRFVGTWDVEVTANMGDGAAPSRRRASSACACWATSG